MKALALYGVLSASVGLWTVVNVRQLPVQSIDVGNFPAVQEITGNFPTPLSTVTVVIAGTPVVVVSGYATPYPTQAVSGTFWQSIQPVSGTVGVNNFPATQPVSGTFWQATQPVSGSVSVSNFPATQPVSGTVAATQSGTWSNVGVTGTFWQSIQPVSGTVTANAGSGYPTPYPTQPVSVVGTPTVNAGTGFPTPYPTQYVLQAPGSTIAITGAPTPYPTQAISATALPLPSNAAQETGGNLATIATNTSAISNGVAPISQPMVQSSQNVVLSHDLGISPYSSLIPRCNNVRRLACR